MYPKISVNLGNLVLSLSDALDLAFSSLAMHQQRTAFIAWELGKQAKLEDRPYRKGMGAERIKAILQEQASRGIQDPNIVKLLLENIEGVSQAVTERQERARHYYQTEVEKPE